MAYEIEWAESVSRVSIRPDRIHRERFASYAAALAIRADRAAMSLAEFPDRGRRVTELVILRFARSCR